MHAESEKLFNKYDVPVPRYTSYPPVPNWSHNLTTELWINHLKNTLSRNDITWSLYLHLPFCESLCTFCACNNVITKDHSREERYINAIHREWELYLEKVPELKERFIKQVHLGGGSPTFFSPNNLKLLLGKIFKSLKINPENFEGAVEVDPRRCTKEQLQALKDIGFNRISLGVQDLDLDVQKNVNRIQPFEMVESCVSTARSLGFKSINFDLIYGLPGQIEDSIRNTARQALKLSPDRIALYSLAVVPWLKPAQNRFQKMEMKVGYEKRRLFEEASQVFLESGYIPMGIDHFAKPEDSISMSYKNESLHRNFMGYTEYATDLLLGLGMSAISETPFSFHQNQKSENDYYGSIELQAELPSSKGHVLTQEDKAVQRQILNIMTNSSTSFVDGDIEPTLFQDMINEGLLYFEGNRLILTERGIPFARHVCYRIDKYSQSVNAGVKKFSSGV